MGLLDLFKAGNPIEDAVSGLTQGASSIIKDFKADPTEIAKAQQALQTLQEQTKQQAASITEQITEAHLKDISDARNANVSIVTSALTPKLDKIVPYLLAALVTLGFFGLLAFMCFRATPPENKDILNILLGSLGTAWTGIVTFFFGSSSSSRAKDETIKGMVSQ